ncbi:hypothetical protein UFOVP49_223 [uncultured Caudovirales phage]|uniref:Uncharacterized protein n=1 Tax=uncultured Caudovirales phage TaxID=2100421 RepID=A0A6J5KTB1_9CAUD|nr:hypothetical protein UFOVP49_223 [uncultured Caudovirales phage]
MFIKTLTVDNYYSKEGAVNLAAVVSNLQFVESDIGKEIQNFNHVSDDIDSIFSKVLNIPVTVNKEKSGIFTFPKTFIHFKGFDSLNEWVYVVALQKTMFNIYEHESGAKTALDDYKFNYRNLFEWDYTVNYYLDPGQGVFFRPWLFHSFDGGLIETFRLKENDN